MHPEYPYIAFFDVDGTLISGNSGKSLVKAGFTMGMIGKRDFLMALFYSLLLKLKLRKPGRIIRLLARWLNGLSEEHIRSFSERVFQTYLAPAIRPEIYGEVWRHKEQNARVVILSSAVHFICEPLAKHLGIDEVICSELEIQNGVYTGRFSGELCYGKEKFNRLNAYCEKTGSSPAKAYYYGDCYSDYHALESVGNPICVNPGKKLAKMAAKRNWIIREWH
ncbi:MAG TPA: HAD family hydrolase [Prolixibacteraceae bacterium]|nr:HAD family hydrolase [Prolixibacteraceae bacterium]